MDAHFEVAAFGDAIDYPNYPAFAPDGRLFVSDSGKFAEANGGIVVIEADGTTTRAPTRALAFANASPLMNDALDYRIGRPAVSAMSLDDTELVRVIELERCVPDGLALDAAGGC